MGKSEQAPNHVEAEANRAPYSKTSSMSLEMLVCPSAVTVVSQPLPQDRALDTPLLPSEVIFEDCHLADPHLHASGLTEPGK